MVPVEEPDNMKTGRTDIGELIEVIGLLLAAVACFVGAIVLGVRCF
jgi:hypothetical protein